MLRKQFLIGIVLMTITLSDVFAVENFLMPNVASQVPLRDGDKGLTQSHSKDNLQQISIRGKLLEEAPRKTQKAWIYSAILPGLGQCYNKDYWKVPITYGVFGLLIWGAIYNHQQYTIAERELLATVSPNTNVTNFMKMRDRDRTLCIVASALWYVINIFDAYVGGTLKTFDVSDDLEVVIKPSAVNSQATGVQSPQMGLNISLQSKNKNEDMSTRLW